MRKSGDYAGRPEKCRPFFVSGGVMKKREIVFGFRIDAHEREMLERVATRLHRTEGDAIRYLIWQAAQATEEQGQGGRWQGVEDVTAA